MDATTFNDALRNIVEACEDDETAIQNIKEKMKERLADALVKHGIDPSAVRSLMSWRKAHAKDPMAIERVEEINQAYRAILAGGTPIILRRADAELEKVMRLTTGTKPPKVDLIMRTIGCSRGKAHKLYTLAAARLAAQSSSSPESDERELEQHHQRDSKTTASRITVSDLRRSPLNRLQKKQEALLRDGAVREAEAVYYPTADTVDAPVEVDIEVAV